MAPEQCTISVRTVDPKTTILDIRGNLDSEFMEVLSNIQRQIAASVKIILLNFTAMGQVSIIGINALVIFFFQAKQRGQRVMAFGYTAEHRQIFHLTRLDEVMPLFQQESDARAAGAEAGGCSVWPRPESARPISIPGWASPIDGLRIELIPKMAMSINVQGRETTGPIRGFGSLWEKRYRLRLNRPDIGPEEVIRVWKERFPSFWPPGNDVYPSRGAALTPGTAALLNLSLPGGMVLSTGIYVIYSDETSFSFISARGHILSAWIIFSAIRDERPGTIIEVIALLRASDPLFELGFHFGAAAQEDLFWHYTLQAVARDFQTTGKVEQAARCVDPHLQWSGWKNIWYNSAIRSGLAMPWFLLKKFTLSKRS
jgi:anti-anti-sigma regulatory factor